MHMRSTGQNLVEDLLTKATPRPATWVPPPQSSAAPTTTMNPAHSVMPTFTFPVSANNHPAWVSNNNTQMGTTTTTGVMPNITTLGTLSTPQPSSIPNIVVPGNKMMSPTTESPHPTIDANNAIPATPRRSNIPNLVIGGIRMPTAASEIKPQPLPSPVVGAPMQQQQQQGMGSAGFNIKSMPTAPLTTPTKGMQGPPQPSNEVNGVLAAGQHTAAPFNNSVSVSTPRVAGTSSMTSHPLGNSTSSMPRPQRIGQQHPTLAQFASSSTVKNTAWGPSSTPSASPSPSAPNSLNNRSAMQNQQTSQVQQLSTSASQRQPPNAGNAANTANDVTSQVGGPTEADADRIRASLPKGWDCQLFVKEGRPNRIVYIDHERKTTSWERPSL